MAINRVFRFLSTMAFLWGLLTAFGWAKPLKIVVTFPILKDMTQAVIGDSCDIHIHTIVKGLADPHTYQLRPEDSKTLADADVLIINDLTFEANWIHRLIESSGFKGQTIVATKSIKPRQITPQSTDPHAWHNVKNAIIYVNNIAQGLQNLDAQGAYVKNAEKYIAILKELDQWVIQQWAQIPASARKVMTTHDAFSYYGDAYGVTFLAPVGISTEAEPSAQAIVKLIDQMKAQNIQAIFIENISNPQMVKQIATEIGKDIKGTLYADTLSDKEGPAATYIDMIKHNTLLIIKALQR